MSRHRLFDYSVRISELRKRYPNESDPLIAWWDEVFEQNGKLWPMANVGGGSADYRNDRAEVWIWANKAKARRIAARLDTLLGLSGTLTESVFD